jgi:hypothetical protein
VYANPKKIKNHGILDTTRHVAPNENTSGISIEPVVVMANATTIVIPNAVRKLALDQTTTNKTRTSLSRMDPTRHREKLQTHTGP